MRVIGTAGHVDHGKSSLIQALTGTHPDRLKEEQEREMTIELGFAWWQLPSGEEVGVVDVPGHRDFIENMLAGIGGIDAVIFVVAADEGIMPQTREHLAILDILKVKAGIVALSKVDMVEDEDWLALVELDLREAFENTVLAHADIVRVSARSGEGLDALQAGIEKLFANQPQRSDLGRPRLPIDRAFSMPGFGTVVTGTLVDGSFNSGDEIEILPHKIKGRIRGLQIHGKKAESAHAGTRTAINISGVTLEQIKRGDVLCLPGQFKPSRRIDVSFKLLKDASHALLHDQTVKLFVGASEVMARVRLLGSQKLNPGEETWLQLEMDHPLITARGDRYILRRPSPGETLGGGVVLDPHPRRRHKRFAEAVLQGLETLSKGTPEDLVLQAIERHGVLAYKSVLQEANMEETTAIAAVEKLLNAEELIQLSQETQLMPKSLLTSRNQWKQYEKRLHKTISEFHQKYPLRMGMPREQLKSQLKMESSVFNLVLRRCTQQGNLMEKGPLVFSPAHAVVFSPEQQVRINQLFSVFERAPFAPPTDKQCIEALGEDVFIALVEQEQLLPLMGEVVMLPSTYEQAKHDVAEIIGVHGSISLAQARDYWQTTRKYVQPILEFMDQQGFTKRQGDVRVLK